jgi:hypothetical protein
MRLVQREARAAALAQDEPAMRFSLLLILAAAAAISGCSTYQAPGCQLGSDCPSGVCNADGTCASPTASSSTGSAGGSSTGTSSGGTGGAGGGSGACTPTHSGMITMDEVPLKAGLHANFRVADNVTVDTAGTMSPDGSRAWDLSMMLSGDHDQAVDTLPVSGQWFAGQFQGATYATQLSYQSSSTWVPDMLGVFQVQSNALVLMGAASPTNMPVETELANTPGATALSFPLHEGATWSSTVQVAGVFDDEPTTYTDDYQSTVDAHGTLKTPFGSFPVLRVGTVLTRSVGVVQAFQQRTFAFVAECFGTVATVTSQTDETQAEFTNALEVSRIAP